MERFEVTKRDGWINIHDGVITINVLPVDAVKLCRAILAIKGAPVGYTGIAFSNHQVQSTVTVEVCDTASIAFTFDTHVWRLCAKIEDILDM
jgi:hypothetical protein